MESKYKTNSYDYPGISKLEIKFRIQYDFLCWTFRLLGGMRVPDVASQMGIGGVALGALVDRTDVRPDVGVGEDMLIQTVLAVELQLASFEGTHIFGAQDFAQHTFTIGRFKVRRRTVDDHCRRRSLIPIIVVVRRSSRRRILATIQVNWDMICINLKYNSGSTYSIVMF